MKFCLFGHNTCHNFGNRSGVTTWSVLSVTKLSEFEWILTGTLVVTPCYCLYSRRTSHWTVALLLQRRWIETAYTLSKYWRRSSASWPRSQTPPSTSAHAWWSSAAAAPAKLSAIWWWRDFDRWSSPCNRQCFNLIFLVGVGQQTK